MRAVRSCTRIGLPAGHSAPTPAVPARRRAGQTEASRAGLVRSAGRESPRAEHARRARTSRQRYHLAKAPATAGIGGHLRRPRCSPRRDAQSLPHDRDGTLRTQKAETWRLLSEQLGGEYLKSWRGDKVEVRHGEWTITLDTYVVMANRHRSTSRGCARRSRPPATSAIRSRGATCSRISPSGSVSIQNAMVSER